MIRGEALELGCFTTEREARNNLSRAEGSEDNGGRVVKARVTESRAHWAEAGERPVKRTRRSTSAPFASLDEMGF